MKCAGDRPNHGGDSISIIADINAGDNSIYGRIRTTREQAESGRYGFADVQPAADDVGKLHHRRFPMAMPLTDRHGQLNAPGNGRPGDHHRAPLFGQQIAPLRAVNPCRDNALGIGLHP